MSPKKVEILLPPDIVPCTGPIVFIAGPIQGAKDWQGEAISVFQFQASKSITVASPRRAYLPGEFIYELQVDWETHYLREAAKNGVILFWLEKEAEHTCDRAFAQTSRFEIGEWKAKYEIHKIRLVVGMEEGFTNASYIRRRLSQDCSGITIHSTLIETCQDALRQL